MRLIRFIKLVFEPITSEFSGMKGTEFLWTGIAFMGIVAVLVAVFAGASALLLLIGSKIAGIPFDWDKISAGFGMLVMCVLIGCAIKWLHDKWVQARIS